MKLSVSLSADDVAVLDEHAGKRGLSSRSAAVQQAIHMLRHADLEEDYVAAWEEWDESADRVDWETVTGDEIA